MKRSQAALEFFFTYGWVIMVVLVVIGALTNAGLLNIEKLAAEECTAGIGLGCIDFRIDENSGTFALINGLGQNIQLESIEMGDCNAKNLGSLNNGQKGAFSISGCENKPDEKINSNIKFRYKTESGIIHTVEGKVIGIVEQGVTPVTGTFTWRAAEQSDFDKGTYVGTESTPQNTVELAPGQSSGAYISKVYDGIAPADWTAIIIDMGGPYSIEVGKINDDKAGASPPFADTTDMNTLLHFNNEASAGETSTLVKDFSGNNNDAVCTGSSCPVYDTNQEKLGEAAMSFDGNDDFLTHTQTNFNKEFTFSSWVKLDSLSGEKYYLKDFRDASNTKAPSFYYDVSNTELVIHDGTSKVATYDFTLPTNEWFQVAATMDFNNDEYKIFIDGEDVGATIAGGEIQTITHSTENDFASGTFSSTTTGNAELKSIANIQTPPSYSACSGTDHNGQDWAISSSATLSGDHCNIGDFTINSGVTVTVQSKSRLRIFAQGANIQGNINADGKGYVGGGPGSYGITGPPSEGPGKGGIGNGGGGGGHGGKGGVGGGIRQVGGGNPPLANVPDYDDLVFPDEVSNNNGGIAYDSSIAPTDFGSGGGTPGEFGFGGNGGGAIFLKITDTLTVSGSITANGKQGATSSYYASGGGAGGSIWIDAGTLSGLGIIAANGGDGTAGMFACCTNFNYGGGGGGGGRIAIYYSTYDFQSTIIVPKGGLASFGTYYTYGQPGQKGTLVLLKKEPSEPEASIQLAATNSPSFSLCDGLDYGGQDLTISSDLILYEGDICNIGMLTINSGVTLTAPDETALRIFARNANILGAIDLTGRGYEGGITPNVGSSLPSPGQNGEGTGGGKTGNGGGGGSYGGAGGNGGNNIGIGGITYGSSTAPTDFGSGGGTPAKTGLGGNGGGAIFMKVEDTLTVSGSITTNGEKGMGYPYAASGAGSGGSIWLDIGTLSGSGSITSNGGKGADGATSECCKPFNGGGGGGGGGRIAVYYSSKSLSTIQANGGGGSNGAYSQTGEPGSSGTITQTQKTYASSGTFASSPIDTSADRSDFIDLTWNANIPSGTSLKFQLAYSADGNSWSSFLGPDGTASAYFTSSGQAIPAVFDGNRHIKYKVFLTSSDGSNTPKLNDVTIKYKALPSIQSVGSTGAIGGRYDLENSKRYSLGGLMDEVGIWNRDLSASEILNLYKRGILKLTLSVRSCDDPNCDGNPAIGPDAEIFTGSFNDAATYALLLEKNRYFQYKAEFETENNAYTPSLQKVEIDFVVS